jgi:hypothetical protein
VWTGLAEAARRELDASSTGAVSEPFSPGVRAAILALTEAIITDGVKRATAEYAVTRWLLTRDSIEECVRLETASPTSRCQRRSRDLRNQA